MNIPVKILKSGTIEPDSNSFEEHTFKELGVREGHVEEFIRTNPEALIGDDESLLIIGQQVHTHGGGRSDLTAVDHTGAIVLIEIKRDAEDISHRTEAFEMQAIRYAANYAKIKTIDSLVDKVFAKYIEKHRDEFGSPELTPTELGRRKLKEFLDSHSATQSFNHKQRIVLTASDFDGETLAAAAWLIANDVDISCHTVTPSSIGEQKILSVNKLLPPPELSDFYMDIGAGPSTYSNRSSGGTSTSRSRATLPRMKKLMEWGLVTAGNEVIVRGLPDSLATVKDEKHVFYNGVQMTFNDWGKKVTGWSTIGVYDWVVDVTSGKTLSELRAVKMAELEESNNSEAA